MRRELVDILRCPDDLGVLALETADGQGDEIATGSLTCETCGFVYPIEEGIPNLLPQSYHVDEVADS